MSNVELSDVCPNGPPRPLACLEHVLASSPTLSLPDIARRLGVSRRTLQRLLTREGLTFQAVRARIRLTRADTLLRETTLKISAVASEIGFGSTGHFIVWFRRHRGATPGAWRLQIAGAVSLPKDADSQPESLP